MELPLEIINRILFKYKGIQTPTGKIILDLINELIPQHKKIKEMDEENYTDQFIMFYFETYFGTQQSVCYKRNHIYCDVYKNQLSLNNVCIACGGCKNCCMMHYLCQFRDFATLLVSLIDYNRSSIMNVINFPTITEQKYNIKKKN